MREKIRELHLCRRRSFQILILAELVLLLAGVHGLFGKTRVYEYGLEHMRVNFGTWDEETGTCSVDEGSGQTGNMVDFVDISLPRGVYRVEIRYQADTFLKNTFGVSRGTAGYKGLFTNGDFAYPATEATDFTMWLLEDAAGIGVHASYGGQGSFSVSGLTVYETNALNRIWIFCVVVGGLLANLCYVYTAYDRQFGISVRDKTVHFALVLLVLFSSMPLMVDHTGNGADLTFHLLRVEGIKDSILNGQFPNRIAPEWQQGYGYAAPIFYGETVLYIMALFRLVGFTILTSYRMFLWLLNIAMALISYWCFQKMFRDKYIGVLCTALYTLAVYRFLKTYLRGGVGEGIVLVFFPILAYGFYRVFSEDVESREYRRSVIPLTVGFSGVIQTHLLSGELIGLFTILLCIAMIKKVFRKQTFVVLARTVIYSCLLSAWFLVPFFDYMLTGDLAIRHAAGRTIQARGLYPAHLLFAFPISGGGTFFENSGMYDSEPANLGIALFAVLLLWIWLRLSGKTNVLKSEEAALGRISAWFAVLSMCMSLYLFPWDRIQKMNPLAASLVSSLQFPSRLLAISVIMLTVLAGVTAKCIAGNYGRQGKFVFAGMMAVMTLIGNLWLLTDMTYHMKGYYLYNEEGMGSGYISGAEYLPYGADASLFVPQPPRMYGGIALVDYEKQGLTVDAECAAAGAESGWMELPLLYYKGYQAWDTETGERFEVEAGENFLVRVRLPAGYSGTVRTMFVSPFHWRIAEAVSVVFLILFYCLSIFSNRSL